MWAAPAIAAFVVYVVTLGSAFLYDDDVLIRTNRWVQDAGVLAQLPFKPLLASPPIGTTNYYRPLVVILYNLMWQSGGGRPFAFHLVNVLIHMLNATLVFQLVRRIACRNDLVALGAALLFAVHPLNVEVVAWPSCLPELGYAGFGLGALLLHVASWGKKHPAAPRYRAAAWVSFAFACACKETAVALLPLTFLLELWLRPGRPVEARPRVLAAAQSVVPYLGAAAVYVMARTAVLGGMLARGAHGTRTLADTVLNAPWLLILYLKSMLFPSPLLIEHVVPLVTSAADPRFLLGTALAIAGVVAILRLRRDRPALAIASCAALLPVLPALYLPALGRDPFAERYAYLGVAGFCWLLVGGADALLTARRQATPRWVLPVFFGVLVLAGCARTIARCAEWRNDGTLGAASIRDLPEAPIGYLLAGNWHLREGRKEDAIGLGRELGRMTGKDAIAAYQRLGSDAAGSASAQFNLGQALLENGRLDEAKAAFTRALQLSPGSVGSMTALAVIASQEGDDATAVLLCRQALAVDDHATGALQQLGVALMRTGDVPGAVVALERAVALDPADKESLSRLGVAYARSGRLDDARLAWERALVIDPQFAGARQNLDRLRQMSR